MIEAIVALASFGTFVMAAVIVFRILDVERPMDALVVIFVGVLMIAFVCVQSFLPGLDFWAVFSLFLCLFMIFEQMFLVFWKSISLRLVSEIHSEQKNRAAIDWVYSNCILAGTFQRRLGVLEDYGLIARRGDTIQLTPKGRRLSHRLMALQWAFGIKNSG